MKLVKPDDGATFWPQLVRDRIQFASKVIGVMLIAVLTAIGCSRGIGLVNAWNGFAPPWYVWACNDAETFLQLDFFQDYNLVLGNSLAMWIYPLAYALFGTDPELTQYIFIFVTSLLYAASLWLLTSTLISRVSLGTLCLTIGMALVTEAANCNLACFGQANLSLGQAYGVAIPLQVIALALVFRERLLFAGVVLGLLACVHLTLAAMTTAVVAAILCWPPGAWRNWRMWTAGGIVLACALGWAFSVIGVGDSYVHMETAAWVNWERFSNCHWFPFDLHVFTSEHYFRLTPFLALTILAFCYPMTDMSSPAVRRGWIIGLAASTIITIIGLLLSLFPLSQSLIMMALHRASGVALLLLLPMAVLGLVRFLERGNAISGAIAVMAIACPFFGTYGLPLFPALVLAGFSIYVRKGEVFYRWQRWALISFSLVAIVYVVYLVFAGHAYVFDKAFVGLPEAWIAASVFIIIKMILAVIGWRNPCSDGVWHAVIMLFIVVLLWHGVARNWHSHPKVPQSEARAYLAAQEWARDNTPKNALFMPDPAHTYGWKDYSRRASYGNIRDWTHSVICYRSDVSKFAEGMRRARKLGVNPEAYLARAVASSDIYPGCPEYNKMFQDVRSAYYSLTGPELINLARDEGIDYFVFELKYVNLLQLKPVYQNSHFAICAPILRKDRVLAEAAFPITLPSEPILCEELGKLNGPRNDWFVFGSRGTIWMNRIDIEIPTLRLVAGTPDQKGEHILLLQPKAENAKRIPMVSGAQFVTFACDMRFADTTNSVAGGVQLRLDVLSSQSEWDYHPRKIDVRETWKHFETSWPLESNTVSICPTLIWDHPAEGCVLEMRAPVLRSLAFDDL